MRVLATMMLGGNIAFLIFLFADCVLKIPFSWENRYNFSVFTLVLHFLPLLYLKDLIFIHYPQLYMKLNLYKLRITPDMPALLSYEGKYYPNRGAIAQGTVFLIVLAVVFIVVLYGVGKGICMKRRIINNFRMPGVREAEHIIGNSARELRIGHVKILQTNTSHRAFTMGAIHPVVVLPVSEDPERNQMMLMHELYHLRQKAALVYFLKNIFLCLYWFNPLSYILARYIEEACEKACDEFVIKDFDMSKKRKYALLLIDEAEKEETDTHIPVIGFSNQYWNIKDRVKCVMSENGKMPKGKTVLLSAVVIGLSSVVPVLACEPIQFQQTSGNMTQERLENYKNTAYVFIPYGDQFDELNEQYGFDSMDVQIQYDRQFIDQYGKIYEIDEKPGNVACQHSYENGQSTEHEKEESGSCVVKYYEAERCISCGKIKRGKLVRTVTNDPCPH